MNRTTERDVLIAKNVLNVVLNLPEETMVDLVEKRKALMTFLNGPHSQLVGDRLDLSFKWSNLGDKLEELKEAALKN